MTDANIHSLDETYGSGKQGFKERPRSNRRGHQAIWKMGGKVIGVYMVMGEYDFVTIGEFPSDEASAAFALATSTREISVGFRRNWT